MKFKKIFLTSFPDFCSTINVKPLKLSLNDCFFTVGKKELNLSLLNNDLDLFSAKGVRKEENIR